ncbi:hypothetical protein SGLAM104S_00516 [Streptomyces glaucescens]
MCMTTVRGSGAVKTARTGTTIRPATLKDTSTVKRSSSASQSPGCGDHGEFDERVRVGAGPRARDPAGSPSRPPARRSRCRRGRPRVRGPGPGQARYGGRVQRLLPPPRRAAPRAGGRRRAPAAAPSGRAGCRPGRVRASGRRECRNVPDSCPGGRRGGGGRGRHGGRRRRARRATSCPATVRASGQSAQGAGRADHVPVAGRAGLGALQRLGDHRGPGLPPGGALALPGDGSPSQGEGQAATSSGRRDGIHATSSRTVGRAAGALAGGVSGAPDAGWRAAPRWRSRAAATRTSPSAATAARLRRGTTERRCSTA